MALNNSTCGKTLRKPEVYEEFFYNFVTSHDAAKKEIEKYDQASQSEMHSSQSTKYFTLFIQHTDLMAACPKLGIELVTYPHVVIPACNKAATRVLQEKYPSKNVLQKQVQVRFFAFPEKLRNPKGVSYEDIGQLICLRGTVVRAGDPKFRQSIKYYRCKICKTDVSVESEIEKYFKFPTTLRVCPNVGCEGRKLSPVDVKTGDKNHTNALQHKCYQEITVQENGLKERGTSPKSLVVLLEDDLLDSCKPGDDVEIYGTAILRWKPFKPDVMMESELIIIANYIQVQNDQKSTFLLTKELEKGFADFWKKYEHNPYEGRDIIVSSYCPKIYGMYIVKLAILVVLAGGVRKQQDGTKVRGESHLLLVGDPGTGKSQMLKFASKLCPRSVMTTGIGTTHAGLTLAAAKTDGEWHFEAGALVLADGGVCCIDEFSCIREHDRTSIHEAMEQQSISVAKAGMVSRVGTRCSIIASTNPKGKYDPDGNLPMNIGLSSPLISRFDMILVLQDASDDRWDEFASDFIIKGILPGVPNQMEQLWELDRLQAYLIHIKKLEPTMTNDSYEVLTSYYEVQRKSQNRDVGRTTVRLLESLIRLSQGHARLMNRNIVTLHDAIMAVVLVESSQKGTDLLGAALALRTSNPENSMQQYYDQAHKLLEQMNLSHLWRKEKSRIENQLREHRKRFEVDDDESSPKSMQQEIGESPFRSSQTPLREKQDSDSEEQLPLELTIREDE